MLVSAWIIFIVFVGVYDLKMCVYLIYIILLISTTTKILQISTVLSSPVLV